VKSEIRIEPEVAIVEERALFPG